MYVCAAGVHGGQKRALELDLQTVVRCHGALGIEPVSSVRVASESALQPLLFVF